MGSGEWTWRRLTTAAVVGFVTVTAVVLLASALGPLPVVIGLASALGAGLLLLPPVRRMLGRHQDRQKAVRERAEQQHRWAARGDARGVYGQEAADLMRAVAPPSYSATPAKPPGPDLPVAEIVHTEKELIALLADRLPSWRYAAFVSVLVQRRAAVIGRIRDARMGFAQPSGPVFRTDTEAAVFFAAQLSELGDLIGQIDDVMSSAAFQEVFGSPHDGDSADANGIVHAAHRLMDYHDRLLSLSERCRAVRVPHDCRELQRDFALLTAVPLNGFTAFIEEFSDRVSEMADVARYATGDVQLDPVQLRLSDDDEILQRISERLQEISHNG